MLDVGGAYAFRLRGEEHAWTPESVASLQHAVRGKLPDEYARLRRARINEQSERLLTLRGLMRLKPADEPSRSTRSSRPPRSSSASPPGR